MRMTTHYGKRAGTVLFALLLASILAMIAAPVSQGQSPDEGAQPVERPSEAAGSKGVDLNPDEPREIRVDEDENGIPYVAGELLVVYKDETSETAEAKVVQEANAKTLDELPRLDSRVFSFPEVKNKQARKAREDALAKKKKALEQDPRVEAADYNYLGSPAATANDQYFGRQWGLKRLKVPEAWDQTRGSGAKIAVLDTGIDAAHPDLAGKLAHQVDFVNNDQIANEDNQAFVGSPGHGTHVAGIAAAATNNGTGIAGVAADAKLQVAKVCGPFDTNRNGVLDNADEIRCPEADQVEGIDWALTEPHADVINISIGGCNANAMVKDATERAWAKGVLIVAAAGNSANKDCLGRDAPPRNPIQYPAAFANVMGVGAVNYANGKANYSSYGSWVDVAAPGGDNYYETPADQKILSTYPSWYTNHGFVKGYTRWPGTSMASPHVAGVAALLASQGRSATQVRDRLQLTASDLGPGGRDDYFGHGLVNAQAAVGATAPTGTIKINAGAAATRNLQNKLTLSATDADGVAQMRFHNDSGTWTAWEPYATTKTWTLRNAQGIRTVYVQYKDKKGSVSGETAIKDTIEYDTVSPSISAITPAPGAHNVPLDASVKITFNDDMMTSTVTPQNIFIERLNNNGTHTAVSAAVTYYASSRTAVLNPVNNLSARATYDVNVQGGPEGSGVKDTAYNEIDKDPGKPGTQGYYWRLYTF